MSGLSTYIEDNLLSFLFRTQASFITKPTGLWIALCTADPGNGTITNEVTGNNYSRASIGAPGDAVFGAIATDGDGRKTSNAAKVSFPQATPAGWGSVSHFAVMLASSGGNHLFAAALTGGPITIPALSTPSFDIGQLALKLD